jgi:hypothetical protein
MPKNPLLLLSLALVMAPPALAQKNPDAPARKLYCWNDNGQRVCSDALPADAVNRAREEISARSGMRTAEVGRALNEEERVRAASEEIQRQVDQAAADTRRRTDQAMLLSYPNEEELSRVFTERTGIVDNSIRMSVYNVTSLREGLVTLLQTAGNRELDGKPVSPEVAGNIRRRHAELLRQRQMQASFERQRKELDVEIADIMQRYRQLKGVDESAPAASGAMAGNTRR